MPGGEALLTLGVLALLLLALVRELYSVDMLMMGALTLLVLLGVVDLLRAACGARPPATATASRHDPPPTLFYGLTVSLPPSVRISVAGSLLCLCPRSILLWDQLGSDLRRRGKIRLRRRLRRARNGRSPWDGRHAADGRRARNGWWKRDRSMRGRLPGRMRLVSVQQLRRRVPVVPERFRMSRHLGLYRSHRLRGFRLLPRFNVPPRDRLFRRIGEPVVSHGVCFGWLRRFRGMRLQLAGIHLIIGKIGALHQAPTTSA
jgi:hypothetical protein